MANPVGLSGGIEFVEYSGPRTEAFADLFSKFGFKKLAQHKSHKVELYRQGGITFLVNGDQEGFAKNFQKEHGPSICSMGWRVNDAKFAHAEALKRGARNYDGKFKKAFELPAIYGIGDSLIYFIDKEGAKLIENSFDFGSNPKTQTGFGYTRIDHLTNNVPVGEMQKWCDFYDKVFGFQERRYFDIKGKKTGLISKVMGSEDMTIIIPINEPTESKSQIQEYLDEYHGSGVQHLALLTDDICHSVQHTRELGVTFLETPDTYFDMIPDRVPNVTEKLTRLKDLRILVDGDEKGYLLQIFTQNIIGPIFFEVIQRKNHDGFGEGNFQALFDAIERDQERRGVI